MNNTSHHATTSYPYMPQTAAPMHPARRRGDHSWLSGLDGRTQIGGNPIENLQHMREIIPAEIDGHVAQTEFFVGPIEIDQRLPRALQVIVAEFEPQREFKRVKGAVHVISDLPQVIEMSTQLLGGLRTRMPTITERYRPTVGGLAMAANP